ncbi:MAG: AAA family ATPase [Candidatus Delongbacteria bacterium]|nr:AAA family ATPase [Candidatus Delongbacteria bacterium]
MKSNELKSKIIVLNGVSSSGKTTIGKILQNQMNEVYFLLGFDTVFELIPEKSREDIKYLDLALTNLNKLICNFANDGINLIIDHLIVREKEIKELISYIEKFEVYFIKVDCKKEIRNKREAMRDDRFIGLSDLQEKKIDMFVDYDLRIDTTYLSPEENAKNIKEFVYNGSKSALSNMMNRYKNHIV